MQLPVTLFRQPASRSTHSEFGLKRDVFRSCLSWLLRGRCQNRRGFWQARSGANGPRPEPINARPGNAAGRRQTEACHPVPAAQKLWQSAVCPQRFSLRNKTAHNNSQGIAVTIVTATAVGSASHVTLHWVSQHSYTVGTLQGPKAALQVLIFMQEAYSCGSH